MILSSLKPPPSMLTKPDKLHELCVDVYVECVCVSVDAYIYVQLFLTLTYSPL